MSITVKAADAAQFLSLIPRLLGCTPTRSLVLVPLVHGCSVGAMRVDLPPDERIDEVAGTAIGMLCRISEVEALMAVVYTDDRIAAPPSGEELRLPGHALVDALASRADACGLRLLEAYTVAADGWGAHGDPLCPPGGRALGALRLRRADADLLADVGEPSRGDQSSGAALPRVPAATRRAVTQALTSLGGAVEVICGIPSVSGAARRLDPAALEAACRLDDLTTLFEEALSEGLEEDPMRTALLGWCLAQPSLRDIALVQWATDRDGGETALHAQRRWEKGAEYPADLASVMWGEGPRPAADRLRAALALARSVAAHVPKAQRPGPLAVCAWMSWAQGRSSHADRYATMALAIDRRHGLAEIVRSFVHTGHLPEWAFQRP